MPRSNQIEPIEASGRLRRDLSDEDWQLAINLSIAALATITLFLMVIVNQFTFNSISKKPNCVFVPWSSFQELEDRPNPYQLDLLSEGSEEFLKRLYQYYFALPWIVPDDESYYISPVSLYLTMGYIASGLNPSEEVMNRGPLYWPYSITSLEEILVGMSFPCKQWKLIEELKELLRQEANHVYITAYIDKDYDSRRLASVFPQTNINITRDLSNLPSLIEASRNSLFPSETYLSLEPTSYRSLKFLFLIGINIFPGMVNDGKDKKDLETNIPATFDQDSGHDALILLSKHSNDSIAQYHYTHIGENNVTDRVNIMKDSIEFLDKNDLTWKASKNKLVENDNRWMLPMTNDGMMNNAIIFRCDSVSIHNITSVRVDAIVLKNSEKTNLTLVLLMPWTKSDFSTLKERFSGTPFQKYEDGEGNDSMPFSGPLTIQLPLISGKTMHQLPMPMQMNGITRIFYDGKDGEQFHKLLTDWDNIVGRINSDASKLRVPNDGIQHQTHFSTKLVSRLFRTSNTTSSDATLKSARTRNTRWRPKEPFKIERTFLFYLRGQNGIIYQFGKVHLEDDI